MTRVIFRLALLGFVCFVGTLAIIHASPHPAALDDFFVQSPGCTGAEGCFMGIRPGVTTIPQAFELLQQHPWVDYVYAQQYTQITWTWSGAQPAYIDETFPGTILQRGYSSVSLIRIQTRFPFGALWLQLGAPAMGYVSRQANGLLHGIYYGDHDLLAINFTRCPAQALTFWMTPAAVQFGDAYVLLDAGYSARSTQYRAC